MKRFVLAVVSLGFLSLPMVASVHQAAASSPTPIVSTSMHNDTSGPLSAAPQVGAPASDPGEPGDPPLQTNAGPAAPDPVLQGSPGGPATPSVATSFDGISAADNVPLYGSTFAPPDPTGEVGPNNYVQMVNVAIAVYSRAGVLAPGFPKSVSSLWSGFAGSCATTNQGDPILKYDHLADRWVVTQFSLPNLFSGPFYECIAVSTTGDPTGTYNRYQFLYSTTEFNDYPKFGVWPDAYYASYNQFHLGGSFSGAGVVAYDRAAMLAGTPATQVMFVLTGGDGSLLPSDLDGTVLPPAGSPNYFTDLFSLGTPTNLHVFKFHVDFTNPPLSTFTGPAVITAAPAFGLCGFSRSCIPQPTVADKVDALSSRLMYRASYRNFGNHETIVLNHSVDVSGTGANHAGVRWYEIRNPGGAPPTLFQQGSYAPDTDNRWMGSMATDKVGDIAVGYSVSSTATFPSIRYAGRVPTDPLGTLQAEQTLINGTGSQTGSGNRWGDYTHLSLDPTDNCTFWYTNEYYTTTSSFNWKTRIGSFTFPSCLAPVDTTPPTCNLTAVITGPPKQIQITVQDTDSGLASIVVTTSNNANTTVPPFTAGTTSPVVVTATKINQAASAQVALTVTDVAGNVTNCDPVLTDVVRGPGKPVVQTISGLPGAEHLLTIVNATPGLTNLKIEVNGTRLNPVHLDDGSKVTLDLAGAMHSGSGNTVTLTATGKPGGSATILVHN